MKLVVTNGQRLVYDDDGVILLVGLFIYNKEELKYSLYGTINILNGDYLGNFCYNFYNSNKVDKNIGGLNIIYLSSVELLLDKTMKYLINEL